MAEYLQTQYEIIPKTDMVLLKSQYVGHGDKRLNTVLDDMQSVYEGIEEITEENSRLISVNTTNIATNTSDISTLKTKVATLEGGIRLKGRVDNVSSLPATAEIGDLYLVGLTTDADLAEYLYTSAGHWELLGKLGDIDLSDYAKKTDIPTKFITSGSQTSTSSADGGTNIYTFAYADGTTSTFTVKNGTKGSTGAQGPQGEKGDTGATGPQGPKGETGATGSTGPQGPKGDTGAAGSNGTSCTHSWNGTTLTVTSASGTSSANLKGEKGDKGDTGDTGPKGDTGPQGPAGQNATTTAVATTSANGLMSTDHVTKLNGIATGATAVTTSTVAGWGYTKNAGTVTQVKVGTTAYDPSSGVVSLPAYPTTLPASDVSSWAKASTKPTYTASEVGAAASSHDHTYIKSKGNYTFDSSTLPNSFDYGVSTGFVNSNSGFGSFGTVLTARSYSGGGGTLQVYAPYGSNYGGTHMKARFGDYGKSSGNAWTDLKEVAWTSDVPTKVSQLTNDSGYTTNSGTVTSVAVKMNGSTKGTVTSSGTIDLGTVITSHQSLSAYAKTSDLGTSAYKSVKTVDNVPSDTGWTNKTTDDGIVPTMTFLAHWNGAYSSSNGSNLRYCKQGEFGSIVTHDESELISTSTANVLSKITSYDGCELTEASLTKVGNLAFFNCRIKFTKNISTSVNCSFKIPVTAKNASMFAVCCWTSGASQRYTAHGSISGDTISVNGATGNPSTTNGNFGRFGCTFEI